ncbi:hypothetical protein [Dasania marina]|uniref:hypothetical protein n=1 Tax=Dasania marina TaxID=471499 RepID=UPI000381D44A|nr:hypothetical protein [Dasania marina]
MIKLFTIVFTSILLALTYGCSGTTATHTSAIIDDRPVLVFNFESGKPSSPVTILIDNLAMGDAIDFQNGKQGLKIISGTHIIKLEYKGRIILEDKIYVGQGSTRTININLNQGG